MAKKTLNFKHFNRYIANDKNIQRKIYHDAQRMVDVSKGKLIHDFKDHPVSREISNGEGGKNTSGTLGGYGNLFSFIGFASGNNPVEDWVNFLTTAIRLDKKIESSVFGNGVRFKLNITSVTDSDLRSVAPMPWEGGRSWIQAIERGISGFSFYIWKSGAGRSGGGIQSRGARKSASSYKSTPYWSRLWKDFAGSLK